MLRLLKTAVELSRFSARDGMGWDEGMEQVELSLGVGAAAARRTVVREAVRPFPFPNHDINPFNHSKLNSSS